MKYTIFSGHRIGLVTLAVSILLTSACKKFIQIPPAPSTLVTSEIFSDSADATAAVVGIYSQINVGGYGFTIGSGAVTFYTALSSDELIPNSGNSDENQFYSDAVSPISNSTIGSVFWNSPYSLIYQTNACLEGISESTSLSNLVKGQLTGECQVIRALIYFNMVNLFNGVPLVTSTNYKDNESLPRSTVDSIYTLILWDLRSADSVLSGTYITDGRVRPNKYTAEALLSKVYLYRSYWDSASLVASNIINSGVYSLVLDPNGVFLSNSSEAIWQLLSVNFGYETSENLFFMPSANNVEPTYIINNYLLASFEPGDLRRADWLDSNQVNGATYYYPYKYKIGYDGGMSNPYESYMVFRLAEQYLIRAESMAELNQFSRADSDLNIIRSRAGLPKVEPSSKSSVLNAIMHERQIELFCEWGNRWYDLKRTGALASTLGPPGNEKGNNWPSDGHAAVYPIPYTQLELNPFLIQNPGY